jgi:hypothetical protein
MNGERRKANKNLRFTGPLTSRFRPFCANWRTTNEYDTRHYPWFIFQSPVCPEVYSRFETGNR